MKFLYAKILVPLILNMTFTGSVLSTEPTVITVDPLQKCGKVNKLIFGNNLEAGNARDIFVKYDSKEPTNGGGAWDPTLNHPVPAVITIAQNIGLSMLRYPGGCLTHNFDWHKAVGPKNERPYYKFGIDEYIELCRVMNAEPLITVSEICTAKDASDLVEYLNSPAKPEYPWAMKRAEWGHREPYHVKYFEMANESDHGNHDVKPALRRNAEEYAEWYLKCAAAMRTKDASTLIGGHCGTATPVNGSWNKIVLKKAGQQMDFFAVHTYVVGGEADNPAAAMQGCMAAGEQITDKLAEYRAVIQAYSGKKIPLAVTEFNATFLQDKPIPLRYTFGAALFCVDYMRTMLNPETNVMFANYWQFLNGFWGYAKTQNEVRHISVKTTAAYPLFKLFAQHTGTELLGCTVANEPKMEFAGFGKAYAAKQNFNPQQIFLRMLNPQFNTIINKYPIKITAPDAFEVSLEKFTGDSYLDFPAMGIAPEREYVINFEVRVTTSEGSITPGLGLCDVRGWNAVKSGCGTEGNSSEKDWQQLESSMISLSTAKSIMPVLRLRYGNSFTGQIAFRNIKISEYRPRSFPPYSAITAMATGTVDPQTIKLIVINKHHESDLPVEIRLPDIAEARLWSVSAPDLAVIKCGPDDAFERISGVPVPDIKATGFNLTIPARSLNALEIKLRKH